MPPCSRTRARLKKSKSSLPNWPPSPLTKSSSDMDLARKVCLITGGTRGIGAATALNFAQAGASLVLVARRSDEAAAKTRAAIEALGGHCLFIPGDVARPEVATQCVERAVQEFGAVDVLVHSAGGPVPGGLLALQ